MPIVATIAIDLFDTTMLHLTIAPFAIGQEHGLTDLRRTLPSQSFISIG
jgi:hypothetical protein